MTRNLYAALAALFLALFVGACESNIENDTGDTAVETNAVTFTSHYYIGDELRDKVPMTVEDTADVLFEGVTGESVTVQIQGSAQVVAGSIESDLTADGYRILCFGDMCYVQEDIFISEDTSEDTVVDLFGNKHYQSNDAMCTVYSNGSNIGERDEGSVETEQGYILRLDSTLGSSSWLEFDGDEFTIKGDKEDFPVTDMVTDVDQLSFAIVDEAFDVRYDYVCEF